MWMVLVAAGGVGRGGGGDGFQFPFVAAGGDETRGRREFNVVCAAAVARPRRLLHIHPSIGGRRARRW